MKPKHFIITTSARLHLLGVPGTVLIQMNYNIGQQNRITFSDVVYGKLLVPYIGQPLVCTITQQKTVAVWRFKKLKHNDAGHAFPNNMGYKQ